MYISFIIFYLTYDIVESPDFEKYYRYFQYYSGEISNTDLDQGHSLFLFYLSGIIISVNANSRYFNE